MPALKVMSTPPDDLRWGLLSDGGGVEGGEAGGWPETDASSLVSTFSILRLKAF